MKTTTIEKKEIIYDLSEKLGFYENLFEVEEKKMFNSLMSDYLTDIQVYHVIKSSLCRVVEIVDQLNPDQYSAKISDDLHSIKRLLFDDNQNFIDEPYELTKRFLLHFNKHNNNADENFIYRTKYFSTIINFVNEVLHRMAAKLQEDVYELGNIANHKIKLVAFD